MAPNGSAADMDDFGACAERDADEPFGTLEASNVAAHDVVP
jgi:hypothetical protein